MMLTAMKGSTAIKTTSIIRTQDIWPSKPINQSPDREQYNMVARRSQGTWNTFATYGKLTIKHVLLHYVVTHES